MTLVRRRPCGKIGYRTQVDALLALKAMELRAAEVAGRVPARAYRCRRGCYRWHLTSSEGNRDD